LDLMARDQQAAMDFYKGLFGWAGELGPDEFGGYAMMTVRDKPVAGIGPAMSAQGAPEPPHLWTTYLASDDAEDTAKRIGEAGGTLLFPPMDVGDAGRMAVAADPTGAVFGFWQAKDFYGAVVVNEPNTLLWNDCRTRDVPGAAAFYRDAFGISVEPMKGAEGYFAVNVAGRTVGGMQELGSDFPPDTPPHWMPWFSVEDVDATVAKALSLGGSAPVPAQDGMPGRLAAIADPWGATFSVLKPVPMEQ
jgi:hypothetical protein